MFRKAQVIAIEQRDETDGSTKQLVLCSTMRSYCKKCCIYTLLQLNQPIYRSSIYKTEFLLRALKFPMAPI